MATPRDIDDVITLTSNICKAAEGIRNTLDVKNIVGVEEIKNTLSEIDVKLTTAAFEFGSSQEWIR